MPKEKLFDEKAALQRAMDLFWMKGYNGTSMDELTRVTGLSRSSIYNSLGDKHALFLRCISVYQAQQQKDLLTAVEKAVTPLDRIRMAFGHALELVMQDAFRKGCLVVNTTTELANLDEAISDILVRNMEDMVALFTSWVGAAQAAGQVDMAMNAQAVARHLYNSWNGLRVIVQTKPDRKALQDIVDLALSVLTMRRGSL